MQRRDRFVERLQVRVFLINGPRNKAKTLLQHFGEDDRDRVLLALLLHGVFELSLALFL
jgi:hypothetical protein